MMVLALLIYPGALLALLLTAVFRAVAEHEGPLPPLRGLRGEAEPLLALASMVLAVLALTVLPWPFHPAQGWSALGSPVLLWAAFEGAFLLPLIPALLSDTPVVARAAIREAQMGAAGRFVIWMAIAVGLWGGTWAGAAALGHVLLVAAGILALPVALGFGPFAPERGLARAATEAGLQADTMDFLRWARSLRSATLTVALILGSLPLAQIQPMLALLIVVAAFAVIVLVLRQIHGALPIMTLPRALRWCWSIALPPALVGLLFLALISR